MKGSIVFVPLSEIYGRTVYVVTLFAGTVFLVPCALAPNIQTLLACRTIAGVFFSTPVVVASRTIIGLWSIEERGVPMAIFSASLLIGPAVGPLVCTVSLYGYMRKSNPVDRLADF
jgi:sugar phosphate permease